jgi:hypothetical protein
MSLDIIMIELQTRLILWYPDHLLSIDKKSERDSPKNPKSDENYSPRLKDESSMSLRSLSFIKINNSMYSLS